MLNQMGDIIRAELLSVETSPLLFKIIKFRMIHGLCGSLNPQSPIMKEGRYSKKYLTRFTASTIFSHLLLKKLNLFS